MTVSCTKGSLGKETVSAILMTEKEAKEMPIYFVSKALRACIVKTKSSRRRVEKWNIKLGEYAIHYRPRVSVKGQILADFIVERPEEDSLDTLMEVEEELPESWILFTDGSSCTYGFEVGLILTNPEGIEFTYALRFRNSYKNFQNEEDEQQEWHNLCVLKSAATGAGSLVTCLAGLLESNSVSQTPLEVDNSDMEEDEDKVEVEEDEIDEEEEDDVDNFKRCCTSYTFNVGYRVLRFNLAPFFNHNSASLSNKLGGFYFIFKFGISGLLHQVITTIADRIRGEWLHIRCEAHVVNLIVQNGIKHIGRLIESIRCTVKWIKKSEVAHEYKDAFARYDLEEVDFGLRIVKRGHSVPRSEDWVKAKAKRHISCGKKDYIKGKMKLHYDDYVSIHAPSSTSSSTLGKQPRSTKTSHEIDHGDMLRRRMKTSQSSSSSTSELDKYNGEFCEPFDKNVHFDILQWWKVNTPRFLILNNEAEYEALIARLRIADEMFRSACIFFSKP
nr:reverse transcriptase domain-containing protein [Tanacetum cinerariifolium]